MEKNINIDFHAHILPGADHGCADKDMCRKQLIIAKKHNIDVVVATPHFYPNVDTVDSFLYRRTIAYEKLQTIYEDDLPKVILGAEVLICNNMDKMEDLEKLCIEGTNTILIEMPFIKHWDKKLIDTVIAIKKERKLNVVLAHVERYEKAEIKKITDMGIDVQINAISMFKFKTRKKCKYYLNSCNVVALGSDMHKLSNGYKYFHKAMKQSKDVGEIMKRTKEILLFTS